MAFREATDSVHFTIEGIACCSAFSLFSNSELLRVTQALG
jgi:hypothetical protein